MVLVLSTSSDVKGEAVVVVIKELLKEVVEVEPKEEIRVFWVSLGET